MKKNSLFQLASTCLIASAQLGTGTCFAQSSVPTSIPVPCLTQTQLGGSTRLDLQPCTTVLSTSNFQDPLHRYVTDKIYCLYHGYIKNKTSNDCTQGTALPSEPSNPAVVQPVCNLVDGEDTQNYLGQSCGDPSKAALKSDPQSGAWEQAQKYGLWIQAMKFYYDQEMNQEILGNNSLNISPACQAMAEDYLSIGADAQAISNKLVGGNSYAIPLGADFCSSQSISQSTSPGQPTPTESSFPKAAACYLNISAGNRVLMFGEIAKCELQARISAFYTNIVSNQAPQIGQIVSTCYNQAQAAGQSAGHAAANADWWKPWAASSDGQNAGQAAGIQAFQQCYVPQIRSFFQQAAKTVPGSFKPTQYNAPGSNQSFYPIKKEKPAERADLSLYSIFFLAGIGIKQTKWKKRAFQLLGFLGLNIIVLSWATYYTLGGCCDQGISTPNLQVTCVGALDANQTPYPTDKMKQCCDPNSSPQYSGFLSSVSTDPQLCQTCNPLACHDDTPETSAAAAAGNARDANNSAGNLSSTSLTVGKGNTSGITSNLLNPTTEAAAAGGIPAGRSAGLVGQGGTSSTVGSTSGGGGTSGLGKGSSSGSSSGGSGGGGLAQAGSTSSGLSSGATADLTAVGAGSGKYSAGGGTGAGARAAQGGGMGGGSVVLSSAGIPGGADLGSGGGADVLRVDDPADYFTRIPIDRSIFAIIHARYQATEARWVKETTKSTPQPIAKPAQVPAGK